MNNLTRLIKAVEGGGFPGDLDELNRSKVFKDWSQGYTAGMAFNGSLDAAKALHESLLPEWKWRIDNDGEPWASVFNLSDVKGKFFQTESDTVARAWLLAILKAYRAQK